MMRKVLNTMSSKDVEELMKEADKDDTGTISYSEFVEWLHTSAPDKVKTGMQKSLSTGPDIVRASFRLWDKNGNGVISQGEVYHLMVKLCNLSKKQARVIGDLMDTDDDGLVDYDEFVDFIFHRK